MLGGQKAEPKVDEQGLPLQLRSEELGASKLSSKAGQGARRERGPRRGDDLPLLSQVESRRSGQTWFDELARFLKRTPSLPS